MDYRLRTCPSCGWNAKEYYVTVPTDQGSQIVVEKIVCSTPDCEHFEPLPEELA